MIKMLGVVLEDHVRNAPTAETGGMLGAGDADLSLRWLDLYRLSSSPNASDSCS